MQHHLLPVARTEARRASDLLAAAQKKAPEAGQGEARVVPWRVVWRTAPRA